MSTSSLPSEDQPPAEWRRFGTEEEAAAALPEESLTDPVSVGVMFCNALAEDPVHWNNALRNLTTPESAESWGDFKAASRYLNSIEDMGYTNRVNFALGAPDVAYFKIVGDVRQSYEILDEQPVDCAAILTLVWRPEYGMWMVHDLGDYMKPEDLPRTVA